MLEWSRLNSAATGCAYSAALGQGLAGVGFLQLEGIGKVWVPLARARLCSAWLSWKGLGWAGLGSAGMGWIGPYWVMLGLARLVFAGLDSPELDPARLRMDWLIWAGLSCNWFYSVSLVYLCLTRLCWPRFGYAQMERTRLERSRLGWADLGNFDYSMFQLSRWVGLGRIRLEWAGQSSAQLGSTRFCSAEAGWARLGFLGLRWVQLEPTQSGKDRFGWAGQG